MNTPAGLTRFSRTITTRRNGTCDFCAGPTIADQDYASVNGGSGKWIAVCRSCSQSIAEQVKGIVRRLGSITDAEVIAAVQPLLPDTAALSAAMSGSDANGAATYDVLTKLVHALAASKAVAVKADPMLAALQAVAADPARTPRDREFAGSLAAQLASRGSLSDKQVFYARKMTEASPAATEAPAGPLEVGLYEVGTDVWWVREGRKSGNVYAMLLKSARTSTGKADWEFIRGGLSIARKGRKDDGTIAAQLGHASHHCCFCGIGLSDDGDNRSVKVGYGPVCARKYGLPWG